MFRNEETCLHGGLLFDGRRLIAEGGIVFDSHAVLRLFEGPPPTRATRKIDVAGKLIAPGLTDLHADALEKCIEMRPSVFFDERFALENLDRRIAAGGITSFCHAVCFADDELGLRSPEQARMLTSLIKAFDLSEASQCRHYVHARFEVGSGRSAAILAELIGRNAIDLISFMDHTPGQGQFKTLQSYIDFYKRSYDLEASEVLSFARRKQARHQENWHDLRKLGDLARENRIPILSHDDDTPQKIMMLADIGVGASEFPVTLEAAQTAKQKGIQVFMGAPNLIRDRSSNGHLRASETIAQALCDGLVSDYYPECLLQAPFFASRGLHIPLEKVFPLVTTRPAAFLSGRPEAGCLTAGSRPDMIVVDTRKPWPIIYQTWVGGRLAYHGKC